jgi:hypothetical protein
MIYNLESNLVNLPRVVRVKLMTFSDIYRLRKFILSIFSEEFTSRYSPSKKRWDGWWSGSSG